MNLRKTVEELDQKYHNRKVVLVDENDVIIGLITADDIKNGGTPRSMRRGITPIELFV